MRQGNEVIIRRNAAGLGKLVSEKTAKAILDATKEIVVNSAGTVFSGMPQQVVGSASGSVNWTGQQLSGIKVNGERIGNIVVNIISGR